MDADDLNANNCIVKVEWANGRINEYRRGYEGKMDVVCVTPSDGPSYFAAHLPTLSKLCNQHKKVMVTEKCRIGLGYILGAVPFRKPQDSLKTEWYTPAVISGADIETNGVGEHRARAFSPSPLCSLYVGSKGFSLGKF